MSSTFLLQGAQITTPHLPLQFQDRMIRSHVYARTRTEPAQQTDKLSDLKISFDKPTKIKFHQQHSKNSNQPEKR